MGSANPERVYQKKGWLTYEGRREAYPGFRSDWTFRTERRYWDAVDMWGYQGSACLAIAAVIAAVAITQSSHNLHAEASVIRTWSYQMRAEPKQLGSTSSSGPVYSPFHIRIDSVEARGQLNVEEKEELFLLNKGDDLVLVIPKVAFDRLRFRPRECRQIKDFLPSD